MHGRECFQQSRFAELAIAVLCIGCTGSAVLSQWQPSAEELMRYLVAEE